MRFPQVQKLFKSFHKYHYYMYLYISFFFRSHENGTILISVCTQNEKYYDTIVGRVDQMLRICLLSEKCLQIAVHAVLTRMSFGNDPLYLIIWRYFSYRNHHIPQKFLVEIPSRCTVSQKNQMTKLDQLESFYQFLPKCSCQHNV